MILNRKQKEILVIKLANEGKTTREIAKKGHISLKDIGGIINRYTGDDILEQSKVKKLTVESQAFQMFKEGKSNVDVAISLNLPACDVISLYQDFLELSGLDKLNYLYHDLNKNLKYFIELYDRMKYEGLLTTKDILEVARAQVRLRDLDRNVYELYDEIGRLNIIKMDLRDKINALSRFQN